ncbi:MAG: alpha/beta hydrolase [Chloroflexi bacterium]|nr:alpha/beta hydrolase [Chloroflexota bacterium]
MARTPTDAWVETNRIRMHYLDWSSELQGERPQVPIVALHGLASSAHWYSLTVPHLSNDYPIYAIDLRAHGQTDQPTTGYDWRTLASDVAGALDALGLDRVTLLGHSWGGNVALSVAAYFPDRVDRLVLIDGGFFSRIANIEWDEYKKRLSPRDIYGAKERYVDALRRQFAHVWTEELERIVLTMPAIAADGTVSERLQPENHEQVLRAMFFEPTAEQFGQVRCPTLIVAASPRPTPDNEVFLQRRRDMVSAAATEIPDCRVHWVANSGHDIGYEQPEELAGVIRAFVGSG